MGSLQWSVLSCRKNQNFSFIYVNHCNVIALSNGFDLDKDNSGLYIDKQRDFLNNIRG